MGWFSIGLLPCFLLSCSGVENTEWSGWSSYKALEINGEDPGECRSYRCACGLVDQIILPLTLNAKQVMFCVFME